MVGPIEPMFDADALRPFRGLLVVAFLLAAGALAAAAVAALDLANRPVLLLVAAGLGASALVALVLHRGLASPRKR